MRSKWRRDAHRDVVSAVADGEGGGAGLAFDKVNELRLLQRRDATGEDGGALQDRLEEGVGTVAHRYRDLLARDHERL